MYLHKNGTSIFLTVLTASLLLTGCAKKMTMTSENGSFRAVLTAKETIKEGRNAVELRLSNAQGAPVDGAEIGVTPWMPEMNHGVLWFPKVKPQGGGLYEIVFHLSMGGLWELRLTIDKDSVTDRMVFTFTDVKGKDE